MNSLDYPQDDSNARRDVPRYEETRRQSMRHPANRSGRHSIRRRLEHDAWRNHPGFAHRLAQRRDQAQRNGSPTHARQPQRRRWLTWQDRTLLILWIFMTSLLLLRISLAEAQEPGANTVPDDYWGIEFFDDGRHLRSTALDTEIDAEITGMVARIDIRQRFRNTGSAWAEAVYRFPLPAGAAVDRLLVHAGQRELQGEIQEKQTARRQYRQARADGMVATLVEQQRPNQFETRLANMGPGEDITVSISFLARVDYRDGTFSFELPLTFTPRWDPAPVAPADAQSAAPAPAIQPAGALNDHHLTLSIRLRSGLSIASLESRYHDMDIHPALGGYDLYLSDPDTRTDRIFELDWKPAFAQSPESALMTWDGGDAVYAMLMLAPPLAEAIAPQPREVVFVIDTSGSMEGISLQQARTALYEGLDRLETGDHFNLIEFNSDSRVLFERSQPADEVNLVDAMDFIDGLTANGGTNMAPALRDAMSLPPQSGLMRQIVFVTDGSVGNEEDLLLQIGDELGDSRLFTVAIGSAPNTAFMRKAAVIGRGSYTHIGRLSDVQQRMDALWGRIENPALQNIGIDWGADAEYFPEVIPDLYAGEPVWLFARLTAEPREVTLYGSLDGKPWEQASRPLPGGGGEILASLWARSKIEALQDSRIFGLDPELIRAQVTSLALEFGLITPYTSLVAVDHTPARPAGAELHSDEIANLLPAGSSAITTGFSPTASGWLVQLLGALLTLLAATGLLWFCTPSRRTQAGGPPRPSKPVPSCAG